MGCGACFSRSAGTTRASIPGGRRFAHASAWIITIGNISFPLAC